MHDFESDLAFSHSASDHAMWEAAYRQAFPTLQAMQNIRQDGWAQRAGIDRLLVLRSGKVIKVDEKVRRKAYDDICIEYRHEYATGETAPGWIAKELDCDYIAYAWIPLGYAYVLPFQQLQRAWINHHEKWRETYFISRAPNRRYVSLGVCVPVAVVLDAVAGAMRVELPRKAA